jgi:hypothetical protein
MTDIIEPAAGPLFLRSVATVVVTGCGEEDCAFAGQEAKKASAKTAAVSTALALLVLR